MAGKKEDLLAVIQAEFEATGNPCTKAAAEASLKAVTNAILKTAKQHESIRTDIGTFKYTLKAAGTARNPATGDTVEVPARYHFSLKAAPSTREEATPAKPVAKTKAKTEAKPTASAKTPAAKPATKTPAKPKVVKK